MSATGSPTRRRPRASTPRAEPDRPSRAIPTGLPDPLELLVALRELRAGVEAEGRRTLAAWRPHLHRRPFADGARNLAHYLALRGHDLRLLQAALIPWGLSSLDGSASRVLATLDAVIASLGAVCGEAAPAGARPSGAAFLRGERWLRANGEELFGPRRGVRRTRIMVTLDAQAADDFAAVRELVQRGMDCARINCAHDDAGVWIRMVEHVRRAAAETGRECRIVVDVCGPRVRTGRVATSSPERRVHEGDRLLLAAVEPLPDADPDADVVARVGCSMPEVVGRLRPGASVWMDDGALGARVESCSPAGAVLRVTHARPKGERLQPDRGLNFPGTELRLGALTAQDRRDLDFVARHADIVGYSFVRTPEDIDELQRELASRHGEEASQLLPLIAKIETPQAVAQLPALIVHAAGRQPLGVMIARGDLAVEIGYERLAEVQEEMLRLCEAAHVPVIWATDVLDRLVKKGTPSRAELTDAAMGGRAECVMLNKGPFIARAVTMLDDIVTRAQAQQRKQAPQLRALRPWPGA